MIRVLCILALLSALLPLTAAERGFVPIRRAAGDHVALIIGNGAYPDVPLANPVNDAVDVGRAFEAIGFQVTVVNDADKAQMLQSIQTFGDKLAKAKAAVFYYAGHGVQVGGSNWLLPVARQVGEIINREDEVRLRAVDANEVLVAMERAKVPVAMVILDACRNNPFKGAGRSGAKGLAQLDAPPGSLVVYATAPGQVAADGNGRNSPFSQAFVRQLLVPGQEVEAMLRNVKKSVRETTQGVQVPWSSSSMTDTFTFVPSMTPDEEASMKRAELAGLQGQADAIAKAEASAAAKRQVEEAALAAKQAEVDKLDAQVAEMRKKMSAGGGDAAKAGNDDDLDRMLAVVQRKESQQKELVAMQQKAEAARVAREADIAKLKQQEYELMQARQQERLKQLETDLVKYRAIAGSDFGKDMAQSAWDRVLVKWGLPTGSIARGDERAVATKVAPDVEAPAGLIGAAGKPAWATVVGKDQYGAWADLQVAGVSQRFRWIQPGTFTMGSSQAEKDAALASVPNSKPEWFAAEVPHQVTLTQGYWLADSSCTQALWQAITGSNPAKFTDSPQNPVEQVSWDDCQQFLSKLNGRVSGGGFRLPSEAQWEYACRAGTTTAFSFGSTITPEQVNYDGNFPFAGAAKGLYRQKTVPVKSLPPNAWGLYEMHGNVWQWCNDWYGDFSGSAERDPPGPSSGSDRVGRGGCWSNYAGSCRSANRNGSTPGYRDAYLGFRIAAQATP